MKTKIFFLAFVITIFRLAFPSIALSAPQILDTNLYLDAAHNEKFDASPGPNWAATAYITWTTNEPTTSQILYGLNGTTNLETYEQSTVTTSHIVRLQYQIEAGKTYTYQIKSRNLAGEITLSEKRTFTPPSSSQWWEVGHDKWYKNRTFQLNSTWLGAPPSTPGYKMYCQTVSIDSPIDGAWIQAGRHHQGGPGLQLFVNGTQIGYWSYGFSIQTFDLKPFLKSGNNTIVFYQDTQNYELFTQGEIVQTTGTISLNSDPIKWKATGTIPSNFNSCTGTSPVGKYDPLLSPFGANLISALPGPTTTNTRYRSFTQTLSRLNKLLESTLFESQEDRSFLSLPEETQNIISTLISQAYTILSPAVSHLDSAQAAATSNNFSSFDDELSKAQDIITQAEVIGEVAILLAKTNSELINLNHLSSTISESVTNDLNNASNSLSNAKVTIGQSNYPEAKTQLISAQTSLNSARTSLENSWGYKLPLLNDSLANPLGWLRFRKTQLFGIDIKYQNNQRQLKLKNDALFALLPPSFEKRFEDAVGFLSPFVIINPSTANYGFGSSASHIAFELNGQIVIKPASGTVYTTGPGSDMTKNWLFVWDQNAKNKAYIIVLQKKPQSISYTNNDIIINQSPSNTGTFVVFNPFADGSSFTSTTTDFGTNLGTNVVADLQKLSKIMTRIPLTYSEAYRDDISNNRGEVYMTYSYFDLVDEWNTPPITIAPLPTLLSFAKKVNYPGITIPGTVTDSKILISESLYDWGTYQFVENTDTLHFYTPLMRDNNYLRGINGDGKDWEIQKAKELGFNAMRLNVGDLILDYSTCGTSNCSPKNTFILKPGWQTALTNQVDILNNNGLTAVLVVWNAVGQNNQVTTLENNPTNQALFIDGWKQIAEAVKNKKVVYDLVNEPDFNDVGIYNSLMSQTAHTIRDTALDTTNPIVIEGYTNFARNFQGVVHPGTSKTYFEHHPYPNGYYQTYSTIDQYYPGLTQDWWNNGYTDRDSYLEEFWKGNIRKIFQDKITFFSGEFGTQVMPGGSKPQLLYDMATLNYRYGIHQTYFKGTGWTMFDIFAGSGDTSHVDTASVLTLLTQYSLTTSPSPTFVPLPGDINNDTIVNILDYTLFSNSFGQIGTSSDLNKDGIVNIQDYIILSNNFGKSI